MMLELCYSYSYGLRVSEICHLRISDIDSQRGQLRIAQGKGEKDCRTFARLLAYLPARDMAVSELPVSAPQKSFTQGQADWWGGNYSLRHAYITHVLEQGCPYISSNGCCATPASSRGYAT
jgi:integrase